MHRCKLFLFGYCVPSHFINERSDEQERDEEEKLDPGGRGRQKKGRPNGTFFLQTQMLALIRLKISRRPRRWTPFAKNFILSMVWGFWITISERQIFYWNMECRALYQYNNTIMWRDQTSTSDHPPRTCHGPSIGHGCRKRKRLYDIWMPSSISSR